MFWRNTSVNYMKIYAYYLPQFHEFPENNVWHEPHYTEWTSVKRAAPLYQNHIQPIHPYKHEYYNLLNKEVLENQVSLAKKYGIDGFVFYHYWFTGKKLMEKPAENFLKWKDIDHDFFFCWANHSFIKKWDISKELLLEQTYGNEEDWKTHFDYLLPFFKDKRYIKIDNKPVFMIYRSNFDKVLEMIDYFDSLCRVHGFDGIYFVEGNYGNNVLHKNAMSVSHMPNIAMNVFTNNAKYKTFARRVFRKICKTLNIKCKWRFQFFTGNELLETYMKYTDKEKQSWGGLFFAWDNTPRYQEEGFVISPISKSVFLQYMDSIKNKDVIIVNAWNEWSEGMILEPSEENQYQYLEWIHEWKDSLISSQ